MHTSSKSFQVAALRTHVRIPSISIYIQLAAANVSAVHDTCQQYKIQYELCGTKVNNLVPGIGRLKTRFMIVTIGMDLGIALYAIGENTASSTVLTPAAFASGAILIN